MSAPSVHDDWLSLIEISGPFLAVPVLKEAFPQGLEELDGIKRKRLRQAYEEWREALELEDAQFAELHAAWIDEVLSRGLELDEDGKGDVLKRADWCAANLQANLPEHGVTLSPALAVVDEQRANKPLLLIQTYEQDVDLDATLKQDGWAATPADRMVQMCRSLGCRLGLVTNGERWMLVDAPVGAVTTFASWYARIWSQEPITLQAFVHLLGIRRFFVDETEQLPTLFDRSLKFQDEVTDALGEQVRRAVEVLIQTLDKADQDRNRELLHDVKEPELYEAALTVMMRLVFLLSAEERGLLLMGDERYEANYALSTLRMQLRKESEEILERRWDAWSRLLAIFRAVFGGIEHENLRLPALGGSLFDPDRFPFLEGRAKGSNWKTDAAKPLPIDNRTVLLLLEAIQQFQGRTLSYRALDVEQIGYVYEGLLERTVKRTDEVTLELDATKSAKTPWIKLAELDSARLDGAARLAALLQERSGSSASRVRNDLAKAVDDTLADRLLTACQGDTKLRDRVKPYAHLLRTDPWGYPLVYPAGAFIVTTGSDRRETGTHYTPKSLTEAIVAETLTPVAYVGPAEGTPREQWVLKSPAELLDLKICDPAMGSGAFLVQACRWLSDRLVEAWSQVEAAGKTVSVDGEVLDAGAAKEPLPRDSEARTVIARRLIAERCLYGVDLNPLAVELAKLSIWLVTLAKGRPFGFLDHNLRCGDSLLGIHRLDQLTELSMTPTGKGQLRLFGQNIEQTVHDAIKLRMRLREVPIRDIHDVEAMAQLDAKTRQILEVPERIADALVGIHFSADKGNQGVKEREDQLAASAYEAIRGNEKQCSQISELASLLLTERTADKLRVRNPFHWPLEFPEVFLNNRGGFDVVIGNPPFLWALRISIRISIEYSHYLKRAWSHAKKNADLCSYFFLRSESILRETGYFGLIATNTISEADTRETSLDFLLAKDCTVYSARTNIQWPGAASVRVSTLCISKKHWDGISILNGRNVDGISSSLVSGKQTLAPEILINNKGKCFKGSVPLGDGFFIAEQLAQKILSTSEKYSRVIYQYINGEELNESANYWPGRWVIYFSDWSLEECEQYPLALEIVKKYVKPVREKIVPTNGMARQRRDLWWKFTGPTVNLYRAIEGLDRVLVASAVSKHHALGFISSKYIYSNALNVFAFDDYQHFAILQSSLHAFWALTHGSKLEDRPRYNVSDCFETFPFPSTFSSELEVIGEKYYEHRQTMMAKRNEGMTKIYNRIHDITDLSLDVVKLRYLTQEMDEVVLASYGFKGINLNHGFQDLGSGVRFTIDESARREILVQLSALNRRRYEEGLHGEAAPRTSSRATRARRTPNTTTVQTSLDFESGTATPVNGVPPATAILGFLNTNSGWHAKTDVLSATGITDGQWNAAITDLVAGGKVERRGERRGARYRATDTGGGCAMMPQVWFEMAEIRRRKFASSVWIPLRAVQPICEEGKRGHLGFKEEFFGAGSLAVPVDLKEKATKLGWSDVGISHEHRACVDDGRYIPADVYEYSRGEQIGFSLVLEQRLSGAEQRVWHLHQDFVIALELMRDGDRWICPNEGYTEVARLHRHPDGRPFLMEAKAEFLLDYLCARGMGLLVTAYWNREEVVEDIAHIDWAESPKHEGTEGARWEGRTYEIHEGGMPFGAETAVFRVSRTDVDPSEDVPVFGFPTDDVTEGRSWSFKREERKLLVVEGEYWRDEWINPGKYSARVRGDDVPGSVFFITDAAGTRESKETLTKESRWLWFRAEVISALLEYRGGHLGWYTRDTGSVTCSPDYVVHFGVNSIGLVNVYAKDIGLLPDWQQRVWAGFNVTPEGGVSEELLASQMRARPADTTSPETALVQALARMGEVFLAIRGKSLFREHPYRNEVLSRIHRFRATDEKGLFALAKDIARLTADSIDIAVLQEIAAPPKGEKWGSLKSLEKVLATVCKPEEARHALTSLVGTYQLRLADAHLPGSELAEAMKLAGIDDSIPTLHQGQTLITNCAAAGAVIGSLLERLANSTCEESHGTK